MWMKKPLVLGDILSIKSSKGVLRTKFNLTNWTILASTCVSPCVTPISISSILPDRSFFDKNHMVGESVWTGEYWFCHAWPQFLSLDSCNREGGRIRFWLFLGSQVPTTYYDKKVGKVSSLHVKCRIVLQDHFSPTSVLQLGKPTEEEN